MPGRSFTSRILRHASVTKSMSIATVTASAPCPTVTFCGTYSPVRPRIARRNSTASSTL
jgi:hypothetical protein